MITGFGKSPIFWEEVFDYRPNGTLPSPDSVINVWYSNTSTVQAVVQAGLRAIYNSGWYLNKQIPEPQTFDFFEDTWIAFYIAVRVLFLIT